MFKVRAGLLVRRGWQLHARTHLWRRSLAQHFQGVHENVDVHSDGHLEIEAVRKSALACSGEELPSAFSFGHSELVFLPKPVQTVIWSQ